MSDLGAFGDKNPLVPSLVVIYEIAVMLFARNIWTIPFTLQLLQALCRSSVKDSFQNLSHFVRFGCVKPLLFPGALSTLSARTWPCFRKCWTLLLNIFVLLNVTQTWIMLLKTTKHSCARAKLVTKGEPERSAVRHERGKQDFSNSNKHHCPSEGPDWEDALLVQICYHDTWVLIPLVSSFESL